MRGAPDNGNACAKESHRSFNMKKWIGLLFAATVAVIFAGCAEVTPLPHPIVPEESGNTVKIGVLLPLTGANAEFGKRTLRGVELAASELNNGRGISSSPG